MLSVFTDFGMRNLLFVRVARARPESRKAAVATSGYWAKFYFSCSLTLIVIAVTLLGDSISVAHGLAYALIAVGLFPADPSIQILRGLERSDIELRLLLAEKFTAIASLIALTLLGQLTLNGVIWVIVASLSGRFVAGAYLVRFKLESKLLSHPSRSVSLALSVVEVKAGLVLLAFILYLRLPVLTIPVLNSPPSITAVTVVLMINQFVLMVPTILSNALFPLLVSENAGELTTVYGTRYLLAATATGIVGTIFVYLLFEYVMSIALGGGDHRSLKPMVWAIPLICLSQACRLLMVASERSSQAMWSSFAGIAAYLVILTATQNSLDGFGFASSYLLAELAFALLSIAPLIANRTNRKPLD